MFSLQLYKNYFFNPSIAQNGLQQPQQLCNDGADDSSKLYVDYSKTETKMIMTTLMKAETTIQW